MKSYLMTAEKSLACVLKKLLIWLKSSLLKIAKNTKGQKTILRTIVLITVWFIGAEWGASRVTAEPQIVYVEQTLSPELQEFIDNQQILLDQRQQDLTAISKVLYGYRYNSDIDLQGIVWVILNRMDNQSEFRGFTTIQDVVNQPSQWMGYSEDNPVLENLYTISDEVLTKYESDGKRLFGQEYLYFEWRSDYITFKTELYDSKTCQKWRAY